MTGKYLLALFGCLLITVLLFSTGCTQAPGTAAVSPAGISGTGTVLQTTLPADAPPARTSEMVAFVKEAAAYADQNGKEKALAEFSSRHGSFFRGDLYIYAYDYNGTTIAHPVNPEKIGVNRLEEKDAGGRYFIRELMDATTDGTGFVEYTYINPAHNNSVERKLGYAMQVDDDWWLGSGIYLGPLQTPGPELTDTADVTAVIPSLSGK